MKLQQKIAIGYIRAKFKMLAIFSKRLAAEKAFELFCTPFMKAPLRMPAIFDQAERLHFSLNGLTVKGFRWNASRPHKVLILHGFGSAAHKFQQYIVRLVEKEYQVLAFDAPAHGSSEGKMINAVEYCQMIEEVLKRYGPIQGFLAHSFGGLALCLAMEKEPHSAETKIVLIAPATETSSAIDEAFRMLRLKDKVVRTAFDQIIFEKSGQETSWFSIGRAMQQIKATILWVHDEEDDVTPLSDVLKVKKRSFSNIRFVITKGLGHRKIYSDAAVKKKVLDFL